MLQLDSVFEIREIRILSHQSKIAATVHVSVGTGSGIRGTAFKGLGYMSLDPNERSNFKARELKKVHVNASGNLLKLSIQKSHINRINMFNQVAIMAIQVLGMPMKEGGSQKGVGGGATGGGRSDSDDRTESKVRALQEAKLKAIENEDYEKAKKIKMAISALQKIGPHLAMLEQKKREAVSREDFDTALAIKKEITRIRSGQPQQPVHPPAQHPPHGGRGYNPPGGRSPSYGHPQGGPHHHQNGFPANNVGYSPHQHMHNQFSPQGQGQGQGQHYHNQYSPQPGPGPYPNDQSPGFPANRQGGGQGSFPFNASQEGPFPGGGPSPGHSPTVGGGGGGGFPANRPGYQPPGGLSPQSNFPANKPGFNAEGGNFPANRPNYDPSDERPIKPMKKAAYVDDRPLPALSKKKGGGDMEANPFGEEKKQPEDLEPTALSDQDRGQAGPWIQVFGERSCACLFDKRWMVREEGIRSIEKQVGGNVQGGATQAFAAVVGVLKLLLGDKVPGISTSACALLEKTLKAYALKTNCDKVGTLLPSLFDKLRSNNARVRQSALTAIKTIVKHVDSASERVVRRLLKPVEKKDANKPLVLTSRSEVLLEILAHHKLNKQLGLGLNPIMSNTLPLLEHRDGKVRDVGVRVITALHGITGLKSIKPYLKDVRQGMLDTLYQSFEKNQGGGNGGANPAKTILRPRGGPVNSSDPNFQVEDGKKGKSPKAGGGVVQPDESADLADEPAGYCQFCEFQDPTYDEIKMDLHYWRECPMLISCAHCEQVVEIASYTQHCLHECDNKAQYKECPTCHEAFMDADYKTHTAKKCKPAPKPEEGNRCPLCHNDIPPWEEGWKLHLLDQKCPANQRTNGTMPPADKAEGGKLPAVQE